MCVCATNCFIQINVVTTFPNYFHVKYPRSKQFIYKKQVPVSCFIIRISVSGKRIASKYRVPRGYSLVDGIRGCPKPLRKVLGCFFVILGILLWVGFRFTPNAANLQNWVHFGKSTIFPNWAPFASILYSDGSQNHAFRGIEGRNSEVYFENPRTKISEHPHPRYRMRHETE